MGLVNNSEVAKATPLHDAYFPFQRRKELYDTLSSCVTDYYIKASLGKNFEARGMLVVGESRQGKTKEILSLLKEFDDGSVIMPDGRAGRVVTCFLSGQITWKDLGVKTLKALGYNLIGQRTQAYIWDKVVEQAKLNGVIGIFFDECQHVFNAKSEKTNRIILDSFKTLLKDPRWPLMLVLTGVPTLAKYIAQEEQLAFLLDTVRLRTIDLSNKADLDEMMQLTFSYAEKAGVDFSPIASLDFLNRLAFACCNRWGLVIEMLIKVFTYCLLNGETACSVGHFSWAFADTYKTPPGYSPFTMPDYKESFDQVKLMEIISRIQ